MKQRAIPKTPNYSPKVIREQSLQALDEAIKILGGHNKFIAELNMYDSQLAAWKASKYGVDPRYVTTIEFLTRGRVPCYSLRMDIFPISRM